jgi:hypothetical protein
MVRSTPWLLEALPAARDVDPPDWLIGGGVLRDLVWDLFGLVCRRNPRRVTVDHYRQRVRDRRIADRWPGVEVLL